MNRCVSANSSMTQRGAVLVTALVLLVVLTLLGLAGMQNTILEERMAGNYRDRQLAFEAAEAALREGEARIADTATFHGLKWDGTDGSHEGDGTLNPFDSSAWAGAGYAITVTDSSLTYEINNTDPPRHLVERLPEVELPRSSLVKGFQEQPPKIRYYRTTARATGKTPAAEVILQSTYFR